MLIGIPAPAAAAAEAGLHRQRLLVRVASLPVEAEAVCLFYIVLLSWLSFSVFKGGNRPSGPASEPHGAESLVEWSGTTDHSFSVGGSEVTNRRNSGNSREATELLRSTCYGGLAKARRYSLLSVAKQSSPLQLQRRASSLTAC